MKNYIENVEIPQEKINTIPIRKFIYKSDKTNRVRIGTSAQELRKVCPELISEDSKEMLSVNYKELSMLTILGIQNLYKDISHIKEVITHKNQDKL